LGYNRIKKSIETNEVIDKKFSKRPWPLTIPEKIEEEIFEKVKEFNFDEEFENLKQIAEEHGDEFNKMFFSIKYLIKYKDRPTQHFDRHTPVVDFDYKIATKKSWERIEEDIHMAQASYANVLIKRIYVNFRK